MNKVFKDVVSSFRRNLQDLTLINNVELRRLTRRINLTNSNAQKGTAMRRVYLRILLCVFVISTIVYGQSKPQSGIDRVEKGLLPSIMIKGEPTWTIQERMKKYNVPGVTIAVIKDFKIEWAKGYGVKENGGNSPVTVDTMFQAASISKPVAAMTALKKVEEGKLTLDENINQKLTSWKLPDNEFTAKKKVTLANLLSHTAGLTVHGFPGYQSGKELPTTPQILDGVSPANTSAVRVDIEPGTKFRYSGGGTTIVQMALMDIEKKAFPQIAEETTLKPLNMSNSSYQQPLPTDKLKNAASAHNSDGTITEGKFHVYPEMAPAGLWTTPTDLAKFAIEVQLSLLGKSNKVISKETAIKMVTPFIGENPGLGFFRAKMMKEPSYFGHGGANEGFRCNLIVHRDKGYGAVVMVNSNDGRIIEEIIRSIAAEYKWEDYLPTPHELVQLEPATLDQYVGRYQIDEDRVLSIKKENGRLYGEAPEVPKEELLPLLDGRFLMKNIGALATFKRNVEQKFNHVTTTRGNQTYEGERISSDIITPYELLISGKSREAADAYRNLKREIPNNKVVDEGRLNELGYLLMRSSKLTEAIEMFKINTEMYPQSSNVYDSLGEAYMKAGNKDLAILNYKKSLELDPKNTQAIQVLKKLEQK